MPSRTSGFAGLIAFFLAVSGSIAQSSSPVVPAAPSAPVAAPAHPVYDEAADAKQQIAETVSRARKENRRVLIQWGGNWCSWCILLHDLMASDPKIKRELMYEYDVVAIDIGKFNKNMDLAAAYGADLKTSGVPYLTVLDAEGKVVANQETGSLEAKDSPKPAHEPESVLKFLTDHQAAPLSAETVLQDALTRAGAQNKRVLLHFGAPWCGWCHRLEDWLAREDVAKVLGRSLLEVKIDQDRMTGASEVFERYHPAKGGGIPWMVVLDAKGNAVVTSDGPEGNIGFPATDGEIAYFGTMLSSAGVPAGDISMLIDSLRGDR